MSTSDQKTIDPTSDTVGLAIFDDVHEVRAESAAAVGLQLVAVVVSYSFVLGLVVILVVVAVLAFTLFWPYLLAIFAPWLIDLVAAGG